VDAGDDLEVLDPVTGEAVARPGAPVPVASGARPAPGVRTPRQRRLRAIALVLALASLGSAGGAAWFGWSIWTLRQVESTWRSALALDTARRAADAEVRAAVEGIVTVEDDATSRAALDRIGDEVAAGLRVDEARLRGMWIPDDRVDAARDLLADALRFRRFQLTPDRRQLGDTPLQRAEAALRVQLDRYRIGPSEVAAPSLRTLERSLLSVRRFADVPTGTVLVALTDDGPEGRELLTIDVDASEIERQPAPADSEAMFTFGAFVYLVRPNGMDVLRVHTDGSPPASFTAGGPVEVVARAGGDGVVLRYRDGLQTWRDATPEFVPGPGLPADAVLLADTAQGLLVQRGSRLEIVQPATGAVVRTIAEAGRFAGASAGFVAVQPPGRPMLQLHRLADGAVTEVQLPRTDAGQVVQSPVKDEFAFAAGPVAGNIASVLRLSDLGARWSLVGVGGPRGVVQPSTLAWSADGELLFWVTPDGHVAMAAGDDARLLRLPVPAVRRLAVASAGHR
jgi:hypothetical protein